MLNSDVFARFQLLLNHRKAFREAVQTAVCQEKILELSWAGSPHNNIVSKVFFMQEKS